MSGVTLLLGSPNLPELWEYELGSMLRYWTHKVNFTVAGSVGGFVPDAVVINLGENDANVDKTCFVDPTCTARVTAAFVAFVQRINAVYGPAPRTFFLTIAPHEKGQHASILPAVAQLVALGVDAVFLNATVNETTRGCGGHPGPTTHRLAYERARPVIAAKMGWT